MIRLYPGATHHGCDRLRHSIQVAIDSIDDIHFLKDPWDVLYVSGKNDRHYPIFESKIGDRILDLAPQRRRIDAMLRNQEDDRIRALECPAGLQ